MKKIPLFILLIVSLSTICKAQEQQAFDISLLQENGQVKFESITNGIFTVPDYAALRQTEYKYDVIDKKGNLIESLSFAVPKGEVVTEEGRKNNFHLYIPYYEEAISIIIYKNENKILEIPIQDNVPGPGADGEWFYWIIPLFAMILFLSYVEYHRLKHLREIEKIRINYKITSLRNYILYNQKKGFSRQQIKEALLQRYPLEDVEEAFKITQTRPSQLPLQAARY